MTGIIVTNPPSVELPPSSNPNNPQNLPGVTYTYALLTLPQTWGAKQTFPLGDISLNYQDIIGLSPSASIDTTNADNITGGSQTGTGAMVRAISPTLVTPVLGAATATSINKYTFTTPATAATLTILNNKTATFNNSIIFAGTDATTMTFPSTTATIARTDAANTFTGHQTIEGVTSTGATGTGNFVFSISPIFTGTVATAGINATNQVNINYGSPNFSIGDTGTSFAYFQIIGSGGGTAARMRVGSDSGAGGALFTGSSANASVIGSIDNNPFQIFTNNTLRGTYAAGGGYTDTGNILSSSATGGVGYATGAGGTVTQLTSRVTGVTLNKVCGAVTLFAAAPAVGTWVSFTVTNSAVVATDVPRVAVKSGTNTYIAQVTAVAAGSFQISFTSIVGTASDSAVINFDLGKAVAS